MRLYLPDDMLKRPADTDISDLTTARPTDEPYWDPDDMLVIPLDRQPTQAEKDAITQRLTTPTDGSVEETLHARVLAAYADLQAFEKQANVSNADVVRIVRLLCKVARGLIRLQLRQLDKTD